MLDGKLSVIWRGMNNGVRRDVRELTAVAMEVI